MFLSNRFFFYFSVIFILWGLSLQSFAGYRDDRHVVWVNLDGSPNGMLINSTIKEFIESGRIDKECGIKWSDWGSTLYMKKRPTGITNDLVKKAFFEKDK